MSLIFSAISLGGETPNPNSKAVNIVVPSGITIEISGEAEIEFINVEGNGGAQYEEDFLKKIETRSPYTQIDKTVLNLKLLYTCLLYTSPSPRDGLLSRMPSSA